MTTTVRIGIVGAGAIAGAYAAAMEQSDGVRMAAVADTNIAAASRLALSYGAAAFDSHHAMIESGLCDAVLVATPPSTHEVIVLDFVSAGVPTLCEKPLAIEGASARHMADAARKRGVLVAMASKFRYVDDLHQAREMMAAGQIGKLRQIENVFTGVVDMSSRWNSVRTISGGGVLIDNGTHCADIIRFVAGPVERVSAVCGPRVQRLDVEDHVHAFVQTETGVLARFETSWSLHKDRADYLGLYGTAGAIELGWRGSRIRRSPTGQWESFGRGYDKGAAFAAQLTDFAAAITGGNVRHLGTLDDAIASVDVVSAGYASMTEAGRWVAVKDVALRSRLEVLEAVS